MPTPKKRKTGRGIAQGARQKKVLWLPLDRDSVAEISIQFRLALEVVRAGQGDAATLNCLAQAVVMTGSIAASGHGEISEDDLAGSEAALCRVFSSGDLVAWALDDKSLRHLTAAINEHDRQLRETRLNVIAEAFDKIDKRLKDGLTLAKLLALRSRSR